MDRVIETDRDIQIPVGGGAAMTVPKNQWLWQLRYTRPEPDRGTRCDDRMLACSSLESYLYLVQECTKEEAWRRIKIMRKALDDRRAMSLVDHESIASQFERELIEARAEIGRLRLALAQNLVDRMGFAPESLEPELRAAYQQLAREEKP